MVDSPYNIPTGGTPITPSDYSSLHENGASVRQPNTYMGVFGKCNTNDVSVRHEGNQGESLAEQVAHEHFDNEPIYPPFTNIRKPYAHIAAKVAAKVRKEEKWCSQ
nr:NADP-dependent malic enzyme gene [Tanacetum cinerariifolium]